MISNEPSDLEMITMTRERLQQQVQFLKELAAQASTEAEAREVISRAARLIRRYKQQHGIGNDPTPLHLAKRLDERYQTREHIEYLSNELQLAVRDAERGRDVRLVVSMPPRSGKSTLISKFTPLWMLQRHPEWKLVMTAHDGGLVTSWAREIRTIIEDRPDLGIELKRDGGAGGRWETTSGGGIYSIGVGGALTGRGARVMIIDDPISDFVSAHSPRIRQNLWNWWLSVAQTRLEPPSIVIVVMTRWHEDDFVGRLLSPEYEGNPRDWRQIVIPALAAGDNDALGRSEGQPLYSPLISDETEREAIRRWEDIRVDVGTYTFTSMYQQSPAPQKGAIFDTSWWRYWTTDPSKATDDGQIVYLDPDDLGDSSWVDSWDAAFKGGDASSSYVVGQRWVKHQANRYLIAQQRGRWSFTQTIARMEQWARQHDPISNPYGEYVHTRLIEEKANGAAIIDTLRNKISGLKPINPKGSKEARAFAVTPEIESGNVYLPHPTDVGNEWVSELMSELRNFPHDTNDDQVDAMTQALNFMRSAGRGQISVPGSRTSSGLPQFQRPRNVAKAALSDMSGRRRFLQ